MDDFHEGKTVIEYDDDDDYHHTLTLFIDGTIFDQLEDNDFYTRRYKPIDLSKPTTYYGGDAISLSWAYTPASDEYHKYVIHIWENGELEFWDPEPPDPIEELEGFWPRRLPA